MPSEHDIQDMTFLRATVFIILLHLVEGSVWLLGQVPQDWETLSHSTLVKPEVDTLDSCLAACRTYGVSCAAFDGLSPSCFCLQWTEDLYETIVDNFPNLYEYDTVNNWAYKSLYFIDGPDIRNVSIDNEDQESYLFNETTVIAVKVIFKWNKDMIVLPWLHLWFHWSASDNTSFKNVNQLSSSPAHTSVWVKVIDTLGTLQIGVSVSTGYENCSLETDVIVTQQNPIQPSEDDKRISSQKIEAVLERQEGRLQMATYFWEELVNLNRHLEVCNISSLVTRLLAQDAWLPYLRQAFSSASTSTSSSSRSTFVEHLREEHNIICAPISGGHQLQQPSLPEAHFAPTIQDNKQHTIFKCDVTLAQQTDSVLLGAWTIALPAQMDHIILLHLLKPPVSMVNASQSRTVYAFFANKVALLDGLCVHWKESNHSELLRAFGAASNIKHQWRQTMLLNGWLFCISSAYVKVHCAQGPQLLRPKQRENESSRKEYADNSGNVVQASPNDDNLFLDPFYVKDGQQQQTVGLLLNCLRKCHGIIYQSFSSDAQTIPERAHDEYAATANYETAWTLIRTVVCITLGGETTVLPSGGQWIASSSESFSLSAIYCGNGKDTCFWMQVQPSKNVNGYAVPENENLLAQHEWNLYRIKTLSSSPLIDWRSRFFEFWGRKSHSAWRRSKRDIGKRLMAGHGRMSQMSMATEFGSSVMSSSQEVSIHGVQIIGPQSSLVPVLQQVEVVATVSKGSQLKFTWDFGDDTDGVWTTVSSNDTWSSAVHEYGHAGEYVVQVTVSNHLQEVTAKLDIPLIVVEPIKDLVIVPVSGKYAAALEEIRPSVFSTGTVLFEARAHRGSHLDFFFDFGHGTTKLVAAEFDNIMNTPYAREGCSYTKEGVYNVSILARNPLGNESGSLQSLFRVQILPKRVKLDSQEYVTLEGGTLAFRATVQPANANVYYHWRFGQAFNLRNTVPEVNFTFTTAGTFIVAVEAYNFATDAAYDQVKRPKAEATVFVETILRGVHIAVVNRNITKSSSSLKTSSEALVVSNSHILHLRAVLQHAAAGGHLFLWRFDGPLTTTVTRTKPELKHTLTKAGRYIVTVIVRNRSSKVTSEPVEVVVVRKLENLDEIRHPKSILVRKASLFLAHYQFGSNLTFQWDFGDGSPVQEVTRNDIRHIYEKTGEYLVNLKVYNAFSEANISTSVFVLEFECEEPYVRLLHPFNSSELCSEEDIRFEAIVNTSCAITMEVEYQWDIFKSDKMVQISDLRVVNQRSWVLRGRTLSSGLHAVSLKVQMTGTIVYTVVQAVFSLTPKPWSVQILGGSSRSFSSNDVVTIRTKSSEHNDTIRFRWDCITLGQPRLPCFFDGALAISGFEQKARQTSGSVSFAASLFHRSATEFLVNVSATVRHVTSSSSQVLVIKPKTVHSLRLSVYCLSCSALNEIISNDYLRLISVCENCPHDVEHEWHVWLILDGNHNLQHGDYDCVQPNGTTFFLNSTAEHNSEVGILANETGIVSTTGVDVNSALENDDILEVDSDSRNLEEDFEEGLPGEAGSATARDHGLLGILKGSWNVSEDTEIYGRGRKIFGGDGVRDTDAYPATARHLFHRKRKLLHIRAQDSTTGLHERILVIKPGMFKVGRTYLIQSLAQQKGTENMVGTATYFVKVDMPPVNGRCSVVPVSGVELTTRFRLNCIEWKIGSKNDYVNYELRYRYKEKFHVIYKGFNGNIKFRLPALTSTSSQKGVLEVLVSNKLGSATRVCAVAVQIVQLRVGNVSTEDILNQEINNPFGILARAIAEKDFVDVSQQVTIMAMMLENHLSAKNAKASRSLSSILETKLTLLTLVKNLTANYKVESRYFMAFISEILANHNNVNVSILEYATDLAFQIFGNLSICVNFEEASYAAHTISSLLNSLHHLELSEQISYDSCRPILSNLTHKLDNYLNHYFLSVLPVEEPTFIFTEMFKITSYCLPHINGISATYNELGNTVSFSGCSCFRIWNYPSGLICQLRHDTLPLIHTNIQVVTKYNCSGSQILSLGSVEDFTVVSNPLADFQENVISAAHLHSNIIHSFKFDFAEHEDHVLIFDFVFTNYSQPIFPIEITLSRDGAPNLRTVIHRWSVPEGSPDFSLQLNKNILQEHGAYVISLINADIFSRRNFLKENGTSVSYTAKAHEILCLHLDLTSNEWKSDGCVVGLKSTYDKVICRCNQITRYGANLLPVNVAFHVHNLDEFIRPEMNWFPSGFVISIISAYFILAICLYRNAEQANDCDITMLPSSPGGLQVYLVSLATGIGLDSGTSAMVSIVLYGENGVTESKVLFSNVGKKLFQRGSTENFLFRTHQNLGTVWKIHVWHDNSGFSPSWYLSHVSVVDITMGRTFYFDCEKWLSVSKGDGDIEIRLLNCNSMSFAKMIWKEFSKCIFEYFIWGFATGIRSKKKINSLERTSALISLVMFHCALAARWAQVNFSQLEIATNVHFLSYNVIGVSCAICACGIPLYAALELTFRMLLGACKNCGRNICEFKSESDVTAKFIAYPWHTVQDWAEIVWRQHEYFNGKWGKENVEEIDAFRKYSTNKGSASYLVKCALVGIVGLTACFAAAIVSSITIRFTDKQTVVWVQIIFISLCLHIFLIQPIVAVSLAIVQAIKKWPNFKQGFGKCDMNLRMLYGIDESIEVSYGKRHFQSVKPPKQNIAKKTEAMKETITRNMLWTVAVIICVLCILMLIAFESNRAEIFLLNTSIHKTLMHKKNTGFSTFLSLQECRSFIEHFAGVFQFPSNTNEEVFLKGTNSFFIGSVCVSHVNPHKEAIFSSLITDADSKDISDLDYNGADKLCLSFQREPNVFHSNILQTRKWINNSTSLYQINFSLYTLPNMLLSSVQFSCEFLQTGLVVPSMLIDSVSAPKISITSYTNVICQLLLFLIMIVEMWCIIHEITFGFKVCLKDPLFWTRMTFILLLVAYFANCCWEERFSSDIYKHLYPNFHGFQDIAPLITCQRVNDAILGLLIFVTFLKSLKVLAFLGIYHTFFAIIAKIWHMIILCCGICCAVVLASYQLVCLHMENEKQGFAGILEYLAANLARIFKKFPKDVDSSALRTLLAINGILLIFLLFVAKAVFIINVKQYLPRHKFIVHGSHIFEHFMCVVRKFQRILHLSENIPQPRPSHETVPKELHLEELELQVSEMLSRITHWELEGLQQKYDDEISNFDEDWDHGRAVSPFSDISSLQAEIPIDESSFKSFNIDLAGFMCYEELETEAVNEFIKLEDLKEHNNINLNFESNNEDMKKIRGQFRPLRRTQTLIGGILDDDISRLAVVDVHI